MVGFDDCGLAEAAFDYIGINRALHQVIHRADFLCLFLEYADKLLSDELSLALRFRHALEPLIEAFFGIHADKIHIIGAIGAKDCLHLIPLILAEQAVIHKYAGQLLANGF